MSHKYWTGERWGGICPVLKHRLVAWMIPTPYGMCDVMLHGGQDFHVFSLFLSLPRLLNKESKVLVLVFEKEKRKKEVLMQAEK